jgi:hypothetical protein
LEGRISRRCNPPSSAIELADYAPLIRLTRFFRRGVPSFVWDGGLWLIKRAPRSAASKRRCVSFHNRCRLVSQPHNFSDFSLSLPEHPHRRYAPANVCIYCGSRNGLHDEHVIPLALGGRWILPAASCHTCGGKTSAFEGKYNRTVLGPLRMLYGIRTRRKKDRPKSLAEKGVGDFSPL